MPTASPRGEELAASNGMRVKLVATARLPGRRRPFGQHGLLPQAVRRRPGLPRRPDRQALVRDDPARRRGGGQARDRGDRPLLQGHLPAGAALGSRHRQLSLGVGDGPRGRGELQRPRPFHRLHRLRVDFEHRRQQPASRRRLPRRRRQGRAGRAVHHHAAGRQRRSEGSLEGPPGLRGQDRRRRPGDRPQRQPVERDHVPGDRLLHRQAADPAVRRDPRALGAALRGDADQGRRRGASVSSRPTTSSPATRPGTSST